MNHKAVWNLPTKSICAIYVWIQLGERKSAGSKAEH